MFGGIGPIHMCGPGRRTCVASAPEPRWHGTARAVDEKGWQLTKGAESAEDTAPVVGGTLACNDSKAPSRQRNARQGKVSHPKGSGSESGH